ITVRVSSSIRFRWSGRAETARSAWICFDAGRSAIFTSTVNGSSGWILRSDARSLRNQPVSEKGSVRPSTGTLRMPTLSTLLRSAGTRADPARRGGDRFDLVPPAQRPLERRAVRGELDRPLLVADVADRDHRDRVDDDVPGHVEIF